MDGFEWLREIRALEPDAGGSAVIAMIAFGPRTDRAHILNAGPLPRGSRVY
jgi:DNA-binding response OmpR family regulator